MWPRLCRCCLFQKPPRRGPLRVRAWRLGILAPGMLPPQQTPLQNSPACSLGHDYYHQASLSHPKTVQLVPWDMIITIRHPSVTPKQSSLFPGTWLLPSGTPQSPQNSPACSLGHVYSVSIRHPSVTPKTMQIVPWDIINIITIRYPSHPKTVYTWYINSTKGTSSTKAKVSECGA